MQSILWTLKITEVGSRWDVDMVQYEAGLQIDITIVQKFLIRAN